MRRHLKRAAVLLGLLASAWAYAEDAAVPDTAAPPATTQGTPATPNAAAPPETTQGTLAAPDTAAPPATTQGTPAAPDAAAALPETTQATPAAQEASKGIAKDVIIVFDNSGSMRKNDPGHLATQAVADLVDGIQGDTRVALVIFDAKVNKAMPLTPLEADAKSKLREALKAINYKGAWTNSPDAVEQTVYDLKVKGREGAQKIIIFFTDGIVETGHPAQDAEKSRWLREELAQEAARQGIKIYAVAFTEGADYQLIQSLATKTGGEYYRSLKAEDLKDAFGRIAGEIAKLDQPKPVEPTPAAATPPAPAAPAAPSAEQPGLKEMEKATGIPKEQLEKMPEGQAIIVKPPEEAEIGQGTQGLLLAIAAAISVLTLVVIVLVVKTRKRGGQAAAAEPEYAPQAFLRDLQGNTDAEQHALGLKAIMLGRVAGTDTSHLNYIVVNQTTIGRRHALIEYKDFSYWVVDQGSMNGTYVNGQRVPGEQRLKHGDHIRLHKCEFEFVMPEVADAGKTVFSAPPPAKAAMTAATTAFTASPPAAPPPPAPAASGDEPFDVTGGAFLTPPAAAAEQDIHDEATELRPRKADAAAPKQDFHEADTVLRPQQIAAAPADEESLATFLNTAVMESGSTAAASEDEGELTLSDFMDDAALTQESGAPPAPAAADEDADRTLMPSQVPTTAPKGAPKSGGAADDDMDRTLMPSQVPTVAPKPGKQADHQSDSTTMFSADDATLPPRRPSR